MSVLWVDAELGLGTVPGASGLFWNGPEGFGFSENL